MTTRLSRRLTSRREELGITEAQMAERLGMSEDKYRLHEVARGSQKKSGPMEPQLKDVNEWAAAFEVPVAVFLRDYLERPLTGLSMLKAVRGPIPRPDLTEDKPTTISFETQTELEVIDFDSVYQALATLDTAVQDLKALPTQPVLPQGNTDIDRYAFDEKEAARILSEFTGHQWTNVKFRELTYLLEWRFGDRVIRKPQYILRLTYQNDNHIHHKLCYTREALQHILNDAEECWRKVTEKKVCQPLPLPRKS